MLFLEFSGHIFEEIFLELQKMFFFLSCQALTPLLVAGPLKKNNYFCGFPYPKAATRHLLALGEDWLLRHDLNAWASIVLNKNCLGFRMFLIRNWIFS